MSFIEQLTAYHKPSKQIYPVIEISASFVSLFIDGQEEKVVQVPAKECELIRPCEMQDNYGTELSEHDIIKLVPISKIAGRKTETRVIRFKDGAFRFFSGDGKQGPIISSLQATYELEKIGNEFQHSKLLRD